MHNIARLKEYLTAGKCPCIPTHRDRVCDSCIKEIIKLLDKVPTYYKAPFKIKIDAERFKKLINGEVVANIEYEIMLADIGYMNMIFMIKERMDNQKS